jgi:hypothetical protein
MLTLITEEHLHTHTTPLEMSHGIVSFFKENFQNKKILRTRILVVKERRARGSGEREHFSSFHQSA